MNLHRASSTEIKMISCLAAFYSAVFNTQLSLNFLAATLVLLRTCFRKIVRKSVRFVTFVPHNYLSDVYYTVFVALNWVVRSFN